MKKSTQAFYRILTKVAEKRRFLLIRQSGVMAINGSSCVCYDSSQLNIDKWSKKGYHRIHWSIFYSCCDSAVLAGGRLYRKEKLAVLLRQRIMEVRCDNRW